MSNSRVAALRSAALDPVINYQPFYVKFYRRYAANAHLSYREARYADAYTAMMEEGPVFIGDDELIVGKAAGWPAGESQADWEQVEPLANMLAAHCGQDSHMAVDYELLLSKGVTGLLVDIDAKKAALDPAVHGDFRKILFYNACESALNSMKRLSERYAEEAELQAAGCADEVRRRELLEISRICRRVPAYPAASFYEAVQAVHFLSFCLSIHPLRSASMQQYQLGRIDRYLLPYYERDTRNGVLTTERAQELLDCLGVMINHRVPRGLSCGYMVGGRDACGRAVSNPLTRMGMQAVENIRLVYPSVGLCCYGDMPETDIRLAVRIVAKGRSHPAFFNDDVITAGLCGYGLPPEEACAYIHSTCVEITPIASSNCWVASPYTNLIQILLDVLDREYTDMPSLLEAYFTRLAGQIRDNFIEQQQFREARRQCTLHPLLSCFVNDCLERGADIDAGGARYNWIMPSFVGLSNLADSLMAIQRMVFERKTLTFSSLRELLDVDFEGFETQRKNLLESVEKYGNDNDEADAYAVQITRWIEEECRRYAPCFSGGRIVPSLFCWIMHDEFGRRTGASPDGRRAGFPLGDGSGPAQGREKYGPTASILSSTKWDHSGFIGGVAVNLKLAAKTLGPASEDVLSALIKTYIQRGGFELQINAVDIETLQKAQQTPELYRDLLVRIGGYSDYFVCLSPTMQAEVMLRSEHVV